MLSKNKSISFLKKLKVSLFIILLRNLALKAGAPRALQFIPHQRYVCAATGQVHKGTYFYFFSLSFVLHTRQAERAVGDASCVCTLLFPAHLVLDVPQTHYLCLRSGLALHASHGTLREEATPRQQPLRPSAPLHAHRRACSSALLRCDVSAVINTAVAAKTPSFSQLTFLTTPILPLSLLCSVHLHAISARAGPSTNLSTSQPTASNYSPHLQFSYFPRCDHPFSVCQLGFLL